MTMIPAAAQNHLSKLQHCYGAVGGGYGGYCSGISNYNNNSNNNNNYYYFSSGDYGGGMSRLEGYGCSEACLLGGSGNLVICTTTPMAEDESRTQSLNEEAAASSSKEYCGAQEEDNIRNDVGSWLQLSIGSSSAVLQTPHHNNHEVVVDQRSGREGEEGTGDHQRLVELDLLPSSAIAASSSSEQIRSFHVPPEIQAPPIRPNYSTTSLFLQHNPTVPSNFPHHQEINYWPGNFRPNSPSSSYSAYFARPIFHQQLHSTAGLGTGATTRPNTGGGGGGIDFRVIDPPRRPHSGIWFILQASQNQAKEPFLPQIPKTFLRTRDGRMTIRLVIKYLVNKLKLQSESEVEIRCRGQHIQPFLTLQHVRNNVWSTRDTLIPPPAAAAEAGGGSNQTADTAGKWGTHVMGEPAAPASHPDNQKAAALWRAGEEQAQGQGQVQSWQQPYILYSPVDKPNDNPFESVVHMFNSWSHKAESIARNIWHNLKTGPSVSESAWGKLNLTAKAITEGGFESLYKNIFPTDPNEKLKKTFACYLSTTTGPVAGTLYLSTCKVAFCSDRPLSFRAPSGQETWSYYKVMVPLGNIGNVNPVVVTENPAEKYIQIVTIDGHEFWFMGFVNYEKATHHLFESVSDFRAHENAPPPPPPPPPTTTTI